MTLGALATSILKVVTPNPAAADDAAAVNAERGTSTPVTAAAAAAAAAATAACGGVGAAAVDGVLAFSAGLPSASAARLLGSNRGVALLPPAA